MLIGAPEWPPLRLKRISELTSIDGIAIRRHGSERASWPRPAQMCGPRARSCLYCACIRRTILMLKRGAKAGVIHGDFEQLLALNDRLDARGRNSRGNGLMFGWALR